MVTKIQTRLAMLKIGIPIQLSYLKNGIRTLFLTDHIRIPMRIFTDRMGTIEFYSWMRFYHRFVVKSNSMDVRSNRRLEFEVGVEWGALPTQR